MFAGRSDGQDRILVGGASVGVGVRGVVDPGDGDGDGRCIGSTGVIGNAILPNSGEVKFPSPSW